MKQINVLEAAESYKEFLVELPAFAVGENIPLSIESKEIKVPENNKCHILVTSFPKSASRRLVDMFNSVPNIVEVNLNFSLRAVEAESLDFGYLTAYQLLDYISHLHTHCYYTLPLHLQFFDVRTIILTRNIFDVLVSIKDHLDKSNHLSHIVHVPESYSEFSDEEKYNFVINHVTPWLIKFHISWDKAIRKNWVIATWLDSSDFIKNPMISMEKIFTELKIDKNDFDFEKMIKYADEKKSNLNVGIAGRGNRILSKNQIQMVKLIAEPYREHDMSLIGL